MCLEESGFLIPTLWGMVFTDEARRFRSIYVPKFSKDYYSGETQKHVSGLFIYLFIYFSLGKEIESEMANE